MSEIRLGTGHTVTDLRNEYEHAASCGLACREELAMLDKIEELAAEVEALRSQAGAVPDGWKIDVTAGDTIKVTMPDGGGCVLHVNDESPRVIPGQVLYELCVDLLAAPPSPATGEPDVAAFVECAWSVLMHDIDPEGDEEATVANIALLKDGFGKLLRRVKCKPAPAADERVRELEKLAKECSDYLDTNNLTSIGHGSILHSKLKDAALAARKADGNGGEG